MKISALIYNHYRPIRPNSLTNKVSFLTIQPSLTADCVSFSSKKNKGKKLFIDDLREIPDLPCGCCGKNMLQNSRVNDFLSHKLYYPASVSLKKIKTEGYYNDKIATQGEKEAYAYLK
jgi:hypothetical protein